MPFFRSLSKTNRWDIVAYVKSFSPLDQEADRTPIAIPPGLPLATAESVNRGREVYAFLACVICHGPQAMNPGGLYEQGELRDRPGVGSLPLGPQQPSSFKNGHRKPPADFGKISFRGAERAIKKEAALDSAVVATRCKREQILFALLQIVERYSEDSAPVHGSP